MSDTAGGQENDIRGHQGPAGCIPPGGALLMRGPSKIQREFIDRAILDACEDHALSTLNILDYVRLRMYDHASILEIDACQRYVKRLKDQGKIKRSGRILFVGGGWAPLYQTILQEQPG